MMLGKQLLGRPKPLVALQLSKGLNVDQRVNFWNARQVQLLLNESLVVNGYSFFWIIKKAGTTISNIIFGQ